MPPRKQTRPTSVVTPAPRTRRPTANGDLGLMWENLTKTFVVLSLALTPLIVSTGLTDTWEQPKTLVLAGLISLAWLSFFIMMFRRQTTSWNWHPLDWLVIMLVAAVSIGGIVSVNAQASWWGVGSWSSGTVPATIAFASLYFLTGQLFRTRHDRLIGWASLLTGTGAALLMLLFQMSRVPLLSHLLTNSPLMNTVSSSPSQVSVIAALFGAVALLLWTRTTERWARWGIVACVVISWLVVFFLRQSVGWAVFAVGMVGVVIDQSMAGRQANVRLLSVAVGIAALGMLLHLTGIANHANLPSANDILLDQSTSAKIAGSALVHRPVLGSGPTTWYQDFTTYRPQSFNQSQYWGLRFVTAAAEWWQQLATGGIVVVGLWFGIFGLSAWWIWSHLRRQPRAPLAATLLTIAVVFLSGFVATWSWVLLLWLWAGLGLSRGELSETKPASRLGVAAPVWLAVLILALIGYWWSASRVTASDVAYQQGRKLYSQTAPIEQVIAKLNTAVRLNSRNVNALTLLGNAEVTKAQLAYQQSASTDLNSLLQPALSHLRQAIAADPNNPALYEEMNNLLNRLNGAVSDVAVEANRNFQKLEQLEPTNPIHDVGDGQTLMVIRATLASAQSSDTVTAQRQTLLTQAIAAYQRALSKKPDYAQAEFALAQALAEDGKNDQALQALDQLSGIFGQVGQYWAERAVVLSNLKQVDLADQAFAQAVKLSPADPSIYLLYANALATAGSKDKAKTTLQQGLTAAPGTSALQQRLDELSK